MRCEIIARDPRGPPAQTLSQRCLDGRPIYGARVVEVQRVATADGEVGMIAIKVIEAEPCGIPAKRGGKFIRQPAFAGAASTNNRDEQRAFHARMALTTFPETSVSRKSRPA